MYDSYFTTQNGIEFEDAITPHVLNAAKKIWGGKSRKATKTEDHHEGTDFFIGDLRMDITMNSEKNNTVWYDLPYVIENENCYDINVKFGVRTGNGVGKNKRTFKEPVLVICFETTINRNSNSIDHIADNILPNHMQQILERGEDAYYEIIDELEAETEMKKQQIKELESKLERTSKQTKTKSTDCEFE